MFSPRHFGEFRRDGLLQPLLAFDVCACGAHRYSEVMATVAAHYAHAATS